MMRLITLFLTCANVAEAQKIANKLLDENLAACIKINDVNSVYVWKGSKQSGKEKLLIIDSTEDKFDRIEAAVKKVHSYDTFVLTAYPIAKSSAGVEDWIGESVR